MSPETASDLPGVINKLVAVPLELMSLCINSSFISLLNSGPWYTCTRGCVTIHLMMVIWVISSFWLLPFLIKKLYFF